MPGTPAPLSQSTGQLRAPRAVRCSKVMEGDGHAAACTASIVSCDRARRARRSPRGVGSGACRRGTDHSAYRGAPRSLRTPDDRRDRRRGSREAPALPRRGRQHRRRACPTVARVVLLGLLQPDVRGPRARRQDPTPQEGKPEVGRELPGLVHCPAGRATRHRRPLDAADLASRSPAGSVGQGIDREGSSRLLDR